MKLGDEVSNVFALLMSSYSLFPLFLKFYFSSSLSLHFPCFLINIIYEGYYLIFDLHRLFPLSHDSGLLYCDCSWHFNKKPSCADPKGPTTKCSESQVKHNTKWSGTVNIQESISVLFPNPDLYTSGRALQSWKQARLDAGAWRLSWFTFYLYFFRSFFFFLSDPDLSGCLSLSSWRIYFSIRAVIQNTNVSSLQGKCC